MSDFFSLADALADPRVHQRAEIAASLAAMVVLKAQGALIGNLPGDPEEAEPIETAEEIAAGLLTGQAELRVALAMKVLNEQITPRQLAKGLLLTVAGRGAVEANPNNRLAGISDDELMRAFIRNWTDFAMVKAGA